MKKNYKLTKLACYAAYFTMSSVFCVPPLLFETFHGSYGISYTLLGTLVLINFCTQLLVDLIFTLFAKKFNTRLAVRVMPVMTSMGLALYALIPTFLPQIAYVGLVVGTVLFSVSAGLSEVLLSPTIAALPSDDPERDMSALHSLYAFGVVTMVLLSTLFFRLFSYERWPYLLCFFALLPIIAAVLFMLSPMPDMGGSTAGDGVKGTKRRALGMALCVGCIFFGSCAENAMSNWISVYAESALGLNKTLGDVLGVAMFAVLLGLARIGYSRFGKHIGRVLLIGMSGAAVCYLTIALVPNAAVAFIACVLTGLFTSMLWPGSLIMMEEKLPGVGVAAYALMAAGGDLGASVAPQLLGAVTDRVAVSAWAERNAAVWQLTGEQLGLRVGMLVCAAFPLVGILLLLLTFRYFKKHQ